MRDFQAVINSVTATADMNRFKATVDESWLQGRTAFGGLSAALVATAMNNIVAPDRRLRSLSVLFVGPVPAGEHDIQLRELRVGGSVSHLQGDLICQGDVVVNVSAAYGKDRPSAVTVASPKMPKLSDPEALARLPYIEGVTPSFTQHFDMRTEYGAKPFSGSSSADFGVWLRFPKHRPIDIAALIALADVPPMPGLNMIKPPGIGSSLSWYLEFPCELPTADASDWWYCDYRCAAAGNGYFHNNATIWGPDGQAVMFSRQIATVFEKH
ncbi:thioesterase family protein [Zhongshania borealis]|uniref:Thioesterase family protein n=1 Tax=Zhongshania borealis TaxID=889488 RepID=A0ABP7WDE3_9GAMM